MGGDEARVRADFRQLVFLETQRLFGYERGPGRCSPDPLELVLRTAIQCRSTEMLKKSFGSGALGTAGDVQRMV